MFQQFYISEIKSQSSLDIKLDLENQLILQKFLPALLSKDEFSIMQSPYINSFDFNHKSISYGDIDSIGYCASDSLFFLSGVSDSNIEEKQIKSFHSDLDFKQSIDQKISQVSFNIHFPEVKGPLIDLSHGQYSSDSENTSPTKLQVEQQDQNLDLLSNDEKRSCLKISIKQLKNKNLSRKIKKMKKDQGIKIPKNNKPDYFNASKKSQPSPQAKKVYQCQHCACSPFTKPQQLGGHMSKSHPKMSEIYARNLKIRKMNTQRRELNIQANTLLVAQFGKHGYNKKQFQEMKAQILKGESMTRKE